MLFGKQILSSVLKIENSAFETQVLPWEEGLATSLSISAGGGKTGNHLIITNTDASQGYATYELALTIGKRYRLVYWHKNGTAGAGVCKLSSAKGGTGTVWYNSGSLNDADWTMGTTDFTAAANVVHLGLFAAADIDETDFWDSVQVFEIMKADTDGRYCKVRGRNFHFYYKPSSGFDRTVKVYGSINDVDYFDLAVTFTNQHAIYDPLLSSLYCDYSGGEVGSADFWIMGRD